MGQAIAIAFAVEGAESLVLGDLNQAGLAATEKMISEKMPSVPVVTTHLDITDAKSVDAFLDLAVSRFGRVDYAVNAAGVAEEPERFEDCKTSSLRRCVAVNSRGVRHAQALVQGRHG